MTNVESETSARAVRTRTHHWPLFLAGMLLVLAGPVVYAVQFRLKHLGTPWYVPILASAGVALMILSLWRRRGVGRAILLLPFAAVCAREWYLIAFAFTTPDYTGPAQPGRPVPHFRASLADGRPFTEADPNQVARTVLVFYRGRW
jgi:hypothetical protein